MFLKSIKRRCQDGDTIVEVMVVLAILGLALSISYATANRSLINIRQAEENAQASRHAQSEIESIYSLAPGGIDNPSTTGYSNPQNVYSQSAPFCVPTTTTPNPIQPQSNCSSISPYTILVYSCRAYMGGPCTSISPSSDTFVIVVTWPDVSGDGSTDSVTQAYRIYPNG